MIRPTPTPEAVAFYLEAEEFCRHRNLPIEKLYVCFGGVLALDPRRMGAWIFDHGAWYYGHGISTTYAALHYANGEPAALADGLKGGGRGVNTQGLLVWEVILFYGSKPLDSERPKEQSEARRELVRLRTALLRIAQSAGLLDKVPGLEGKTPEEQATILSRPDQNSEAHERGWHRLAGFICDKLEQEQSIKPLRFAYEPAQEIGF